MRRAHGNVCSTRVDERAELELLEPDLLAELAAQRLLVGLARLDAAADASPTTRRR